MIIKISLTPLLFGLFFLFLWVPICSAKSEFDFTLPDLPVIDGADWAWAGEKMRINGIPTSIKSFRYKGTSEQVKQFYRHYWRGRGTGQVLESLVGFETVLGFEWRGYYQTVQFYADEGVIEGKLVVTLMNGKQNLTSVTTRLPLLPGNTVKSRVDSMDNGIVTESTIIRSNRSVAMNLDYLQRELERDGWRQVSDSADLNKNNSFNQARKIILQKANELIHAIAYPPAKNARNSELTVHWRK